MRGAGSLFRGINYRCITCDGEALLGDLSSVGRDWSHGAGCIDRSLPWGWKVWDFPVHFSPFHKRPISQRHAI